ncbi:protein of unknown function [Candidatus Nitrosocaldus cavascurensis]|uniref:Uncharacterized protein n=1 Tax=Candidatus Nitrosocaldus cavascurensis TaxID=2058097 RepID=A0A2K5ARK1_9ARCH|nr:protein of unknown function [Candidatus Nitrosocaldus cavascurensis]
MNNQKSAITEPFKHVYDFITQTKHLCYDLLHSLTTLLKDEYILLYERIPKELLNLIFSFFT